MRTPSLLRPTQHTIRAALLSLAVAGAMSALAPASPAAAGPLQSDLVISGMQSDLFNPIVGEVVNTFVDIRNYGAGASGPVSLTVTLAPELQPTSPSFSYNGWTCAFTAPSLACSYSELAAGQSASRLFVSTSVTASATADAVLPITATIAPQHRELSIDNNSDTVSVTVGGTSTIKGTVWHDLDGDGQREPGEPPVVDGPDGVLGVSLFGHSGYGGGGASATVGPDGSYRITARSAAPYAVRVEASGAYDFTVADTGDDATDSDIVAIRQLAPTLIGDSAEFTTEDSVEYVVNIGLIDRP